MTSDTSLRWPPVPSKLSIDQATRIRVAAHLRSYLRRVQQANPDFTQKDLAKQLGVSPGQVSRLLNETGRSLGLDLVLAINRNLHIDAEVLLNQDPTEKQATR